MIKNVYVLQVKYPLFLSDFNETWNFSTVFLHIKNFAKILPMGAELFHAGGRTDIAKLIVAFCNFANAPKNTGLFQKHNNCNTILINYKHILREVL